jgi:hypothetical protein
MHGVLVMSAEKEIINFWCNKKGYFTVSNLKSNNRDLGIVAIKADSNEATHIQVSCSLTGFDESTPVEKISEERFYDDSVISAVQNIVPQGIKWKKMLVLSSIPKSKKENIMKEFRMMDIEVVEFENIIHETFLELDTHYYKNDVIRTMQLMKFVLNDSSRLAKMIVNNSSASRKEFVSTILDEKSIMKEFRMTNKERLGTILKSSGIRPEELAHLLEHDVLNNKTRKIFIDSLNEQEKIKRVVSKIVAKKKKEMSLEKFM